MKKPSDVTKLVLKKSKKFVIFRFIISLVYRAIAMIIPILLSMVVDAATGGKYKQAIIISLVAILSILIFFDSFNFYDIVILRDIS